MDRAFGLLTVVHLEREMNRTLGQLIVVHLKEKLQVLASTRLSVTRRPLQPQPTALEDHLSSPRERACVAVAVATCVCKILVRILFPK